jgi:hypothetical protein
VADDVREQLMHGQNESEYIFIQFGESTDVSNVVQFVAVIICISEGSLEGNTLLSKEQPGHTTGQYL